MKPLLLLQLGGARKALRWHAPPWGVAKGEIAEPFGAVQCRRFKLSI
ncbi:hypothetical protein [Acidovorax sp. PRC11]|nr:hypothetical protein [Acidovorax sp. PRC11]MDT0138794.1 hypothetical protein [Acidovorax sp. PRC11]